MLKRSLLKKIFLIMSSLFILFILYLFPVKDENVTIKNNNNNKDIKETSIYLIDSRDYVSRVNIVITDKDKEAKIKEIINYLTVGSASSNYIKEGFNPIIPKGTKLLSLSIVENLAKLNFSKDFYKISESLEDKLISSIIYSVTGVEGIEKISIYIDGHLLTTMPHSKNSLPPVLDRTFGVNKIYDLTSFKGTTSTTVYYLSKYKDYYYYVPVTMINNKNNEKIEIIIKELTSKTMYQTNLISYLNDAKEISYEITDEYMFIRLSGELYSSLNESKLLETVIYTVNLSIKDNYDIKSVTYMMDDNVYKTYSKDEI